MVITLRALAQETIKNLVLAGVGRIIVMDDKQVSQVDLGASVLFREEDGDVGKLVGRVWTSLSLFYIAELLTRSIQINSELTLLCHKSNRSTHW